MNAPVFELPSVLPDYGWGLLRHDAARRTPTERAALLRRLGLRRVALDWRYNDLGELDAELAAMRAERIAVTAIWAPISLEPLRDQHLDMIFAFIDRHALQLSLWTTLIYPHAFHDWAIAKRLDAATGVVASLADRAAGAGCRVALYNFDGWFGRPANQVRIIAASGRSNIDIVYNFENGDAADFGDEAAAMLPHLAAINLAGVVNVPRQKLAFGEGAHEFQMLHTLLRLGYHGPFGLACGDARRDAQDSLACSIAGLARYRDGAPILDC